jgi:hypothetical protein
LGKSVNLKITSLGFCKSSLTVIALVALKNNFTDKQVPHIVISGNRSSVYEFNLADFKLITLHAPYTVHGKLGIMPDAVDSSSHPYHPHKTNPSHAYSYLQPQPQLQLQLQLQPQHQPQHQLQLQTVNKPELTLSVDNSPPPGSDEKEEFYMGHKIHKGVRGGKYYFSSDGSKRYYLTEKAIASSKKKEDVVYNINLLSCSSSSTACQ